MPNMVPRYGTAGVEEKVITQEEHREEPERYIIEGVSSWCGPYPLQYDLDDLNNPLDELLWKLEGKRLRVTVEVLPKGDDDAT